MKLIETRTFIEANFNQLFKDDFTITPKFNQVNYINLNKQFIHTNSYICLVIIREE